MKILVFGAGAIGSVFGGFLSKEHEVYLVGRKPHLKAIKKSGLQVEGIWGRHNFRFRGLAERREALKNVEPFDLVLVTVKSYDTLKAARMLRPIAKNPNTIFLALQNGLGNIEKLAKYLPEKQIMGGRVIFGVEPQGFGKVKVTVIAEPTAIGEIGGRKVSARAKHLVWVFKKAGLSSHAARDIHPFLWMKVIYNAMLNPLASLLEVHYGKLGESSLSRSLMNEVAREAYRVAKALGMKLSPPDAEKYLKLFYRKLLPSTFHHHPSMLQDLKQNRQTEIDAINGMIIKHAKAKGVSVPVNRFLVRAMKEREKDKKKRFDLESIQYFENHQLLKGNSVNTKKQIKAVIFDLGNVLILHDARKAARRFAKDLGVSFEKVWDFILTSPTEKAYTRGELTTYAFYRYCMKVSEKKISYLKFRDYWNEIFKENKGMDDLLEKLKKHYPLYMISNTNPMHWAYLRKKFPHIFKHFKKAYPSHKIGARKPDPKCFRRVLKWTGLRADEAVFIDDSRKFVAGANAVGLHAIRFTSRKRLLADLKKMGIRL